MRNKQLPLKLIERPKKKVKKIVELWANIYEEMPTESITLWGTKIEADYDNSIKHTGTRVACVKLTGVYEIEE